MTSIIKKYKRCFSQKGFLLSLTFGVIFLVASIWISYLAGLYATASASNPVTDILLNNLPFFNLDKVFIYGAIVFMGLFSVVLLTEPKEIPFVVKSIGLLVLIRSFSVVLTHIGPFPQQTPANPAEIMTRYFLGADYFFSGHTAVPFLVALMFWNLRWLRYTALAVSAFFGSCALLGHLHYSIDVFGAFFITYSIFHMARWGFARDYRMFQNGSFAE